MKQIIQNAAVLLLLAVLNSQFSTAHAQGTAFTYQGQLQNNGSPASGIYALSFTLFNTNATGVPVAGPVTNNGVVVSNGLFTVQVDFGSGAFIGQSNWLEIAVATNLTTSFTTLAPRQVVTPTPYAIYAETASNVSGTVSAAQISGAMASANLSGTYGNAVTLNNAGNSFNGNGSGLTGVNAATLNGFGAASFWQLGGNAGTTPGVNFVGTTDGQPLLLKAPFVGVGRTNRITPSEYFGVQAPVAAGSFGGMYVNATNAGALPFYGYAQAGNVTAYHYVDGSDGNKWKLYNSGNWLTVTPGGNVGIGTTTPTTTLQVNGTATATAFYGNGGGLTNLNVSASQLTSIGNTNVGASGNFFVGPSGNSTTSGEGNTAYGVFALDLNATGSYNTANGASTLQYNFSGDYNVAIGGSAINRNISGSYNTAVGSLALATLGETFFTLTTTGGSNNIALGYAAGNNYYADESGNIDIGNPGIAGEYNTIHIGNGQVQTFIAGNVGLGGVTAPQQTLSLNGGMNLDQAGQNIGNVNSNSLTFGSGSGEGIASKRTSGGSQYDLEFYTGFNNRMTILNNGNISFAGNVGIGTNNPSVALEVSSGASAAYHLFQIESSSSGTSKIVFSVDGNGNCSMSGNCTANGVLLTSDRNAKENFSSLDAKDVLDKVISLPVSEWNYKNNSAGTRHIGPMAQDFHAAFQLDGADDKHISVVDESGVALAAIQGLNQKLESEVKERDAEIQNLEKKLGELQSAVKQLAANK